MLLPNQVAKSCVVSCILGTITKHLPSAFAFSQKVKYSSTAMKFAQDLSNSQYERLKTAGAMDIQRPITIRASNVNNGSTATLSDSSSSVITKLIHFQRHGQGYHNLLGDIHRETTGNPIQVDDPDPKNNPFVRPEIYDSPLTQQGRQECATRRQQASKLSPEVIIVSPLHRAIQTALISFSDHCTGGEQAIPMIAHEGCREQLGFFTCNKRLPLSQTINDFPLVDFTHVTPGEEDTLWNPHERELPVDESNRVYDFMMFLMNRPEKEIAVVGHSAWLFNMCNTVLEFDDDEGIQPWFLTSEIRSMQVSFHR